MVRQGPRFLTYRVARPDLVLCSRTGVQTFVRRNNPWETKMKDFSFGGFGSSLRRGTLGRSFHPRLRTPPLKVEFDVSG